MKIELRRLKIVERMSQETTCFIADVYIDGKKVGTAQNEGCGGSTNVAIDAATSARIKAHVDTLGANAFDGPAAYVVDALVFAELERRDAEKLKKKLARYDVKESSRFEAKGMLCARFRTGDTYRWVGIPKGKSPEDARDTFAKKYPDLIEWALVS